MWYDRAMKQSDLSNDEQELCFGPELAFKQYGHALLGEIKFAAARIRVVSPHQEQRVVLGRACNCFLIAKMVQQTTPP